MDYDVIIEIDKLADLVRRCCLENTIPVNPEDIIYKLEGEILKPMIKKDHVDFKIEKNGNRFRIYIDSDSKFMLAKALGWLFINMGYIIDKKKWKDAEDYIQSIYTCYSNSRVENEYKAELFALALLMPKNDFIKQVDNNCDKETSEVNIDNIKDFFKVTIDLICKRGKMLGVLA